MISSQTPLRWQAIPLRESTGVPSRHSKAGFPCQLFRRRNTYTRRRHFRPKVVARAAKEATLEANTEVPPLQQGNWHAVVANADFMLHDVQNESFAEQLRERRRLYTEKGQPLDFWLVTEPIWLERQFPQEAKKVGRPCVALVSTDEVWIDFMKLRLDRVLQLNLGQHTLQQVTESGGPLPPYQALDKDVKWTAPYPPYRPGWWKAFMRGS